MSFGCQKNRRIRNVDLFILFNSLLFAFMCAVVYFERFIEYKGMGNIHEFFVYAAVIFSVIGIAWWYLRHFTFSSYILILVQFGILAHFAGGFVPIDGGRLYDAIVLGIRYDKYVHFINAYAAATVVSYLFDVLKAHLPLLRNFVVIMTVMGLGAMVEVMEYLVMKNIPDTGVGSYDNNMQDLIANLVGGVFFIVVYSASKRRSRAQPHLEAK